MDLYTYNRLVVEGAQAVAASVYDLSSGVHDMIGQIAYAYTSVSWPERTFRVDRKLLNQAVDHIRRRLVLMGIHPDREETWQEVLDRSSQAQNMVRAEALMFGILTKVFENFPPPK